MISCEAKAMPKRIDEERLETGLCLPGDLRNNVGQVLLPAGAALQPITPTAANPFFGISDWKLNMK